jgi:hypothetical protein
MSPFRHATDRGAMTPDHEHDDAGKSVEPVLPEDAIERIAQRVAQLIAPDEPSHAPHLPPRQLTAAEVADWWGITRAWVYEHADDLHAARLGAGQRPRLRFDPAKVAEHLGGPTTSPTPTPPASRRQRGPTRRPSQPLLPIQAPTRRAIRSA